jgi:chitodextrinase
VREARGPVEGVWGNREVSPAKLAKPAGPILPAPANRKVTVARRILVVLAAAMLFVGAAGAVGRPSPPRGLVRTQATQTSITVRWRASRGATGYAVYRNTTRVAFTKRTSFVFARLRCGTRYALAVAARDRAGRRSRKATLGASTVACGPASPTAPPPVNALTVKQDGSGNYTTIASCVTAVKPGDACLVYPGVYNERINVVRSGTPGALITIEAATPRAAQVNAITISGSYDRVEGFKIANRPGIAMELTDTATHSELVDNYAYKVTYGVIVHGNSNLVDGNEVERLYHPTSDGGDADYGRFFGTNHVIRDNFFHGTRNSEIADAHVDGFQTFDINGSQGSASNILFENNIFMDLHEGVITEAPGSPPITGLVFRGNIVANSGSWGFLFKNNTVATLENNVTYNNKNSSLGFGDQTRLTLSGNMWTWSGANSGIPLFDSRGGGGSLTNSCSLYWRTQGYYPSGTSNVVADPQFANPTALPSTLGLPAGGPDVPLTPSQVYADLKLASTSPARNNASCGDIGPAGIH